MIKDKRHETLEQTLEKLSSEETLVPNYSLFPRTTHLYKSDLEILQKILTEVRADGNFISSDVVHSASDLGLTHKIQAKHRNGSVLIFDGLYIRVTTILSPEKFKLDEVLSKTGAPRDESDVIDEFVKCVQKALPGENVYGKTFYNYYTVTKMNWEKLGLRRQGDAQVRLVMNDPNYVTITALVYTKWGKDFHVYLGEEDRVHDRSVNSARTI